MNKKNSSAETKAEQRTDADNSTSASLEQNGLLSAVCRVVPYQLCPKCNGQGTISKPPYISGDVNQWSSSSSQFQCDVCQGQKIIPMFILPEEIEVVQKESKTSLTLEVGDVITLTKIIEPMRKCLSMGKTYMVINISVDHKGNRKRFEIIDDNGNKKWYRLDTFLRRWRSV
jgi:hypothetical protein